MAILLWRCCNSELPAKIRKNEFKSKGLFTSIVTLWNMFFLLWVTKSAILHKLNNYLDDQWLLFCPWSYVSWFLQLLGCLYLQRHYISIRVVSHRNKFLWIIKENYVAIALKTNLDDLRRSVLCSSDTARTNLKYSIELLGMIRKVSLPKDITVC